MSKVAGGPDLQVLLEQMLRICAQGGYWTLRGRWMPQAMFGVLYAAGLPRARARAINVMIRRTARAWRKAGEPVSDDDVRATAARLLV